MGDDVKLEHWVNESRGAIGVLRKDPVKGTKVDLVQPGRQVLLTPEERRLTEDSVAKEHDNPFRNGRFSYVHLVEDADDVEEIRSNPNVISRGEIDEFLKLPIKTMEARVKDLTSVDTLERILDVANREGAATRRVQALRDRLGDVKRPAVKKGAQVRGEPVFSAAREPWYPKDGDDQGDRGAAVG